MKFSRRSLFGIVAGAAAAPVLPKVPDLPTPVGQAQPIMETIVRTGLPTGSWRDLTKKGYSVFTNDIVAEFIRKAQDRDDS